MENFLTVLQTQIVMVLVVFGAFALVQTANILLGVGIAQQGENTFNKTKLKEGVIRFIATAVGSVLLVLSMNTLGFLVEQGMEIEGFTNAVNTVSIVGTLGIATIAKAVEVYGKLKEFSGIGAMITKEEK